MSLKINFLSLLFLLTCLGTSAQPLQSYELLRAEGEIPASILTPSSSKYEKEIAGLLSTPGIQKASLKDQKRFALNSNFAMDDLLKSGLVLFNDPISVYLNAVKQGVISANPSIPDKVEIYALRSTEVNAFASDRGEIFVTLGLLAQLENEAQLAFILSHELAHVAKGHAQDKYLKSQSVDRQDWEDDLSSDYGADPVLIRRSRYSREIETEADRLGLEYFLNTQYKASTLPHVFDVFQFAYLPFNEVPMTPDFLGGGPYHPAARYRLSTVKPIELKEEKEDERQSHPGIEKRRQAMMASVQRLPNAEAGTEYLLSEERFREIRTLARYELPALYLHYDRFPEALYHAYLLHTESPDNFYLRKTILQCLHMVAKMKNDPDVVYQKPAYERIEGESQQAYYLFSAIPDRDISILALRYGWDLLRQHPQDAEVKELVQDLFIELNYHVDSLGEFSVYRPKQAQEQQASATAPLDTTSKYGKLRQMKNQQGTAPDSTRAWVYAFPGETLSDTAFRRMFEEGKKIYERRVQQRKYFSTEKGKKEFAAYEKMIKREGYALGIDSIVIVSPNYIRVDARDGYAVDFIAKEAGQRNLVREISFISSEARIHTQILDIEMLDSGDIETFNDLRLLNEWFFEQGKHRRLYVSPGYRQGEINQIAEKYGTDFFLWTGVASIRAEKDNLCCGVVVPFLLPFFLADAIYTNNTLVYGILMNVRTGQRQVLRFEEFSKKDSPSFIRAQYYDILRQIQQERS